MVAGISIDDHLRRRHLRTFHASWSAMGRLHGSKRTTSIARMLRRTMTHAERILWRELRDCALGVRFRRQHPTERFVLDFFAPSHGLAIELDGPVHAASSARDRARDRWLLAAGVRTLRFTNEEVERDLPRVLQTVRLALEGGTALPAGEGSRVGAVIPGRDVGAGAAIPGRDVGVGAVIPGRDVGVGAVIPGRDVGAAAAIPGRDVGVAAAIPATDVVTRQGFVQVGSAPCSRESSDRR